jgi:ABC-type hemin transport system substrate-binding protein
MPLIRPTVIEGTSGKEPPPQATRSIPLCLAIAVAVWGAGALTTDPPRRIVPPYPDLTEILYGVGAFAQVAGVSDYCTDPPEVRRLPSVGGWRNPNLERLTELRPDLVIADDGQAPFVQEELRQLGFRLLVIPDRNVFQAITLLGRETGHEQAVRLRSATRNGQGANCQPGRSSCI